MGFRQGIVTARQLRTGVPPNKRWEIDSNPSNQIRGYSAEPTETAPGMIEVDNNGAGSAFMRIVAPTLASTVADPAELTLRQASGTTEADLWAQNVRFIDPDTGVGPLMIVTDNGWRLLSLFAEQSWHDVGTGGEPALTGTWVTGTAGPPPTTPAAQFRRFPDGTVEIRGRVRDPGAGGTTTIFTLPVGYRPTANVEFAWKCNNDPGTVAWGVVQTTGAVGLLGNVAAARVLLHFSARFSTR